MVRCFASSDSASPGCVPDLLSICLCTGEIKREEKSDGIYTTFEDCNKGEAETNAVKEAKTENKKI